MHCVPRKWSIQNYLKHKFIIFISLTTKWLHCILMALVSKGRTFEFNAHEFLIQFKFHIWLYGENAISCINKSYWRFAPQYISCECCPCSDAATRTCKTLSARSIDPLWRRVPFPKLFARSCLRLQEIRVRSTTKSRHKFWFCMLSADAFNGVIDWRDFFIQFIRYWLYTINRS